VVLTERYIYSAIARAIVRGADPDWIRSIYDFAIVPDAIFYLRLRSTEELAARVLASGRGFDYWESGMDLRLGNDYYDSFVAYQKLLLREFDRMTGEYRFQIIDAARPIRRVAAELRRAVKRVIGDEPAADVDDLSLAQAAAPDAKKTPLAIPAAEKQQES